MNPISRLWGFPGIQGHLRSAWQSGMHACVPALCWPSKLRRWRVMDPERPRIIFVLRWDAGEVNYSYFFESGICSGATSHSQPDHATYLECLLGRRGRRLDLSSGNDAAVLFRSLAQRHSCRSFDPCSGLYSRIFLCRLEGRPQAPQHKCCSLDPTSALRYG